jgi:diguanylate cyclase (GGDEF)-like protein
MRAAESMEQYSAEAANLVNSIWPADDLLLLHREEGRDELRVLAWVHAGVPVALDRSEVEVPSYRWASLPVPVKEALRRGFYSEAGLPFSQDSAFPQAKSFVAMALEHRGGSAGVILACTAHADPPSAEPLRRSRPLFSVGFGRAMYVRELSEAVIRDAMTGAFTYDHFLTIVRHEVARATRYTRSVACALIDVDGLRRVNSEHGSAVGDRVITEVAQVVGGAIRSSDIMARVSGGRLALLLPETNEEGAGVVAERVRRRVQEHPFIVARGLVERITVSVGVAVHPPLGVTAMALVDAAERTLTEAKRRGRNQVVVAGGERSRAGDLESRQTA